MSDTLDVNAGIFDPVRLTQARRLAGLTKRALGEAVGVSSVAIGQWEAGANPPRPDHLVKLCEEFDVPLSFMLSGRPHARLEIAGAHFRSLRSTPLREREKAVAFTEQLWELTHVLERHVELPPVDLPGFSAGELSHDAMPRDPSTQRGNFGAFGTSQLAGSPGGPPAGAARNCRVALPICWRANCQGRCLLNFTPPRPLVVLTPDRADDVYRHRFTAAHELGHLVLHGDAEPGDRQQEREADQFAAEFLTPRAEITPLLPSRMDMNALSKLSVEWGVSVSSLIYRCREIGLIPDATYRRAFQRLAQLTNMGLFQPQPVRDYPGKCHAS